MILGFNIRIIAYLRRCTRALEAISGSLDVIAHCVEDEWNAKHAPRKRTPAVFGELNIAEVNKQYRKQREAAGFPSEEEE